MDTSSDSQRTARDERTEIERPSDCELVVTRIIEGPRRLVFRAWTEPELFRRWWTPKSFPVSLLSCELDVRVGGGYRLVYGHEGSTAEFFGRYLEVAAPSRLVWTNDEDDNTQVTTVTFEEAGDSTVVVVHDRYPSKEARDSGSTAAMPEQLAQLDELVASLARSDGGS